MLPTLATEISAHTVYSLNVLVPMKWNSSFPLHVNRLVPSGITPCPWVTLCAETCQQCKQTCPTNTYHQTNTYHYTNDSIFTIKSIFAIRHVQLILTTKPTLTIIPMIQYLPSNPYLPSNQYFQLTQIYLPSNIFSNFCLSMHAINVRISPDCWISASNRFT